MVWTRSLGILASLFCFLSQFPLSGCSKPNQDSSDIHLHYESQPNPPHVGSNILVVRLNDRNGAALSGANVRIEGDMSHPGMSPVIAEMKEVGIGAYYGELNLGMRGDWVVEFHIVLADGRKLEREAEFKNVRE